MSTTVAIAAPAVIALLTLCVVNANDDKNHCRLGILSPEYLRLRSVRNAVQRHAVCNDQTPAKYYFSPGTDAGNRWVIFLESGGGCSDIADCNERYERAPELMSSSRLPLCAEGTDLLSRDRDDNPLYWNSTHVLVPYCSSDLFLGQTSKLGPFYWHNDSIYNDFSFRGFTVFRSIVEDLLTSHGLHLATHVVLSGSSAGGIGAMAHAKWMKNSIPHAEMKLLIDSAWFINFHGHLETRLKPETNELIDYTSVEACQDDPWLGYPCCLSAACMIQRNHLPSDVSIYFVQSLYDIFILKDSIAEIADAAKSSAEDVLRIVNGYGGAMNASMQMTSSNRIGVFSPACFQHVYFATSSLWKKSQFLHPHAEEEQNSSLFTFRHVIQTGYWDSVRVNGYTLKEALLLWHETDRPIRLIDTCHGAHCNSDCPDSVGVTASENLWSAKVDLVVVVVAVLSVAFCVGMKLTLTAFHFGLDFEQSKRVREGRSVSEKFSECEVGVSIACLNLSYAIRECLKRGKKEKCSLSDSMDGRRRMILNNVSVYFNPGQMVAIMGPSGCGKTSLLNVLSGRRQTTEITGDVYVNGMEIDVVREWYVENTGYVLQLATPWHDELTVRQTLTYSAFQRLPQTMPTACKFDRIEQVLRETGLLAQADRVVGGQVGPGLSGGQKRRLAVALQLLSRPNVLFLDEPTSGLDAASSLELLSMLHVLAMGGRLVVVTIHQPRLEIFHLFDNILLLSKGQVAYYGTPFRAPEVITEALKAEDVFQKSKSASNPADAVLDALNDDNLSDIVLNYYFNSGEPDAIEFAIVEAKASNGIPPEMLEKRVNSGYFSRLVSTEARSRARSSFFQKIYLTLILTVYGIVVGGVYWNETDGTLLMAVLCIMSCASPLLITTIVYTGVLKPLELFRLEHRDGVGRPFEFVFLMFCRLSALSAIPFTILTSVTYGMVLASDGDLATFGVVLLTKLQLNQSWLSIYIFTVCVTPTWAHRICPLLAAVSGFFSGLLVPVSVMPSFLAWIYKVNPTYWAYGGIARQVLVDRDLPCSMVASSKSIECYRQKGNAILYAFQFEEHGVGPVLLALLLFQVAFVGLTVGVLQRQLKPPSARKSSIKIKPQLMLPNCCCFTSVSVFPVDKSVSTRRRKSASGSRELQRPLKSALSVLNLVESSESHRVVHGQSRRATVELPLVAPSNLATESELVLNERRIEMTKRVKGVLYSLVAAAPRLRNWKQKSEKPIQTTTEEIRRLSVESTTDEAGKSTKKQISFYRRVSVVSVSSSNDDRRQRLSLDGIASFLESTIESTDRH